MIRFLFSILIIAGCHTVKVVEKQHGLGGQLLVEPSFLGDWQADSSDVMSRTCRYKGYKASEKKTKDGKISIDFSCRVKSGAK